MYSHGYQQEKEQALDNEALTDGQRMTAACREYAANIGSEKPDTEWILTDFDTWERNPCYRGKPGPHPEDRYAE